MSGERDTKPLAFAHVLGAEAARSVAPPRCAAAVLDDVHRTYLEMALSTRVDALDVAPHLPVIRALAERAAVVADIGGALVVSSVACCF